MQEDWLPIQETNGLYLVSNCGRIMSRQKMKYGGTNVILKLNPNSKGYLWVSLGLGSHQISRAVHRLVGNAFLGPLPHGMTTNHKDSNKQNNSASNLEYITAEANIRHARASGLQCNPKGEQCRTAILTETDVRVIRMIAAERGHKYGRLGLALQYGVAETTIRYVVQGHSWRHLL